ncbi:MULTISPECIES: NAD-glutamate dehydrogenase [Alphaproteobacteria]|uniref:NAD-glutamate dehydrogenase n=2 Tax=Alphaproteobacteria TaxID=28211 RepID=A0A512HKD0_9HYPH|nr:MULTISPECIES: NAD-glutamate dehydrogenase [Alphaproteobacteria]GEO85903.1 NAD-glutamate dehydrogenase [Ciceribacter naphthalenivorans]GLR21759.1 NAD-glutamate dehydrogenase [Ciceribacter naphthalenivorans]GLT04615.1 NAD-glutamate dehydrogenase [Sphingomonas psychrolutea]
MVASRKPRREQQFESARRIAIANGEPFIDPGTLFSRAANDDLDLYTPEMLALSAVHAATDIAAWNGETPRIAIKTVPEVAPGGTPVSILSIVDRNKAFLYDSVMSEVTSVHREISMAIHPILVLAPGGEIALCAPELEVESTARVSYMQIHLAPLSAEQSKALQENLANVLAKVKLAYTDWKPMLSLLDSAIQELSTTVAGRRKADRDEALAFLDWLRKDNFTFLGMREYIYSGEGADAKVERSLGQGLGILSDPDVLVLRQGKNAVTTTPEILAFLQGPDFLIVTKANVKSVVHRRAYMDYVGVKRFGADGKVVGELRIVGLFTATAYTRSVNQIPLLRAKVDKVISHFDFDPQSHSGRILENTLESYPRDDLFQIDTDLLAKFCEQINDLAERPRVRVLPRIDQFDRFVSLIVYVPREDYNSIVREKIGHYFRTVYNGHVSAYYPAFPEGGVARVHIIIGRSEGKTPRIAQGKLEEAVREITARWDDRFATLAGAEAPRLSVTQAYQEAFSAEDAVKDLRHIQSCRDGAPISIAFHEVEGEEGPLLYLKIFHTGAHLPLSRRVPLLENLGFNVISERTFDIGINEETDQEGLVVLHDMELQVQGGGTFDVATQSRTLEEAFVLAFTGTLDNDAFNRLVLTAGVTARQATVLRAYAAHLRQCGFVYSPRHIADTLYKYPAIAATILALFERTFDPKLSDKARQRKLADARAELEMALSSVPSLDEDRILRRYINSVDATLRTNYFQQTYATGQRPMLAFKFDPHRLEGLPEPRPFREIFVYGVEVEGVHLRFGKVARGGLRWSDRAQDYRTEVLGLVKAQQVKNAVIVPVGAKGGFFPKQLPVGGSRDAWIAAGTEAYKTYITTMLSITDNIEGGKIVPPVDTIRLDDDDPYFVVAADKGTATFSDTANGLAQAAGFWLDDAFASGGSAGYDHKKMGITARGAWEAVKRHFREMNIDIQTTPFSVAGVGDMSGDVFGNGMLLSEKIRLIAAFDHRDIFIDPDPDTAVSFAERKRMFALPRSSWQDYDKALLSTGGMIISRAEKSITLTPQAATAIGLDKTVATPFDIINAILKAQVDLLWFGGIGTYIKATEETDAEVGDRANDAIRITGGEVRAKVIGEGANLGVTQKGRIAFALAGGQLNSDAIDNSAGVNSSDVEVNIKIALSPALADKRLTRDKRDKLLAEMTDEVAALVLRNNYLQTLAISLTERKGAVNREELGRLMNYLESLGRLNRKVEVLPGDAAFAERYASGKPLTRPEIGILLSYAKIVLFDQLVASDLPDDPYCESALTNYFPARMRKTFASDIAAHRLHREIIATVLANHVINRGGPGFITAIGDATGALPPEIVKAALITRDGLQLPAIWDKIDALDAQIPGETQNSLYAMVGRVYAGVTRLLVETGTAGGNLSEALARLKSAVKAARQAFGSALPDNLRVMLQREVAELVQAGAPADLAEEVVAMLTLQLVPEVMQIAGRTGAPLARVIEGYFTVSDVFRVDRILVAGNRIVSSDHYESLALGRSLDQIAAARRNMVVSAFAHHGAEKQPVRAWLAAAHQRVERLGAELAGLSEAEETNLAKITVAAGLLSDLANDGTR